MKKNSRCRICQANMQKQDGVKHDANARSRHKEISLSKRRTWTPARKARGQRLPNRRTNSCPIFYRCHVKHAQKYSINLGPRMIPVPYKQ